MQNSTEKLDCFTRVITPENIEFEYALAGPFQRLPAFVFDFFVRATAFIGLMIMGGILTSWMPINGVVLVVGGFLLFFALSWFYGIFMETRFNGRTFGKMVFKLRVISVDGRPINGVQAALRNLLRLADMGVLLSFQIFDNSAPPRYMIPTLLVGLVAMTLTTRLQRIGDLAAGTMVISEGHRKGLWNLQPEDLRVFGLAELIPRTYRVSNSLAQTVALYMENRRRLAPLRRNEVARHLAGPLIRTFDLLPDTSPDLLLCALYVNTYMSEDQREDGRQRLKRLNGNQTAGTMPVPDLNLGKPAPISSSAGTGSTSDQTTASGAMPRDASESDGSGDSASLKPPQDKTPGS